MGFEQVNILGIDSTTRKMSIAVSRDSRLISQVSDSAHKKHMVNIIKNLDRTLARSRMKMGDIDYFGVNLGPGDFTGTRIGISIIKTLSWLEEKPAYGVNALDIHAVNLVHLNKGLLYRSLVGKRQAVVVPCLDVRRQELYFSFYMLSPILEMDTGKDIIKGVAEINIGCSKFLISRIHDFILVTKDGFIESAGDILKKDLAPDKVSETSSFEMKETLVNNPAQNNDPVIIIGGNSLLNYRDLILRFAGLHSNIMVETKSIYAGAEYINMIVNFRAGNGIKPENPVPVYVREFVPFGNK
jgi:tRNA threonylcarbamoyl adenosine modification protein YeaZ